MRTSGFSVLILSLTASMISCSGIHAGNAPVGWDGRSATLMPISLTDHERDELVALMQTLTEMKEVTGAAR